MRIRTYALFLLICTFCVYFFSFGNQFIWDDEQFIYKNAYVQSFAVKEIFTQNTVAGAGEISNYYRPLTTLSFALDFQVWNFHVLGYHLTNAFLHIFSGLLLFQLLVLVKFSKKMSFWLSVLFLLHPIQTEAVTYMNSRGDSLYTFFSFLSLLCILLLIQKRQPKFQLYNLEITITNFLLILGAILSYTASIFSKEIGIATLGLQYLLVAYWLLQTRSLQKIGHYVRQNTALLWTLIVNTCVAFFYLYLRATVLNFNNSFNFYSDNSLYATHTSVRLLTFTKVLWVYFKLLLFPYPLHMERSTDLVTSAINFWPILTISFCMLLIYLGWREYSKNKSVLIWFGMAWFFCMLAPVSGIIPINGVLYEHWLYTPMIGFFITLLGLSKLLFSTSLKLFLRKNQKLLSSFVFVLLAILTIRQNYFWSTPIRFYEYLIQYEQSGRVFNNLAMAYADAGDREKAISAYKKSLEFGDFYPQVHHNMGNTYRDLGNIPESITEYKKALSMDPHFFHSYNALAELYIQQNNFADLLTLSEAGIEKFPTTSLYYYLKILALSKLQKFSEATGALNDMKSKFPADVQTIREAEQLLKTK